MQAMQGAPQGAVYVWCNAYPSYAKALARALGRADLRIETPGWLEYRYEGVRVPIVLDHALLGVLSPRQQDGYAQASLALAAMGIVSAGDAQDVGN